LFAAKKQRENKTIHMFKSVSKLRLSGGCGMRVKMEAGCKITEILMAGCSRKKETVTQGPLVQTAAE